MKKILVIIAILSLSIPTVLGTSSFFNGKENQTVEVNLFDDYDPLVDISVTLEIKKIRSLEKRDTQIPTIEKIDDFGNPDFYVKVFINDEEFVSPIWHDTKYVYDPQMVCNFKCS